MARRSLYRFLVSSISIVLLGAALLGCGNQAKPTAATSKPAATTAAAKPYYEGKSITLVNVSDVGGGTDTWMRMVQPFLQKHIPGHPTIVCENMPGGYKACNYVWGVAKTDGTYLLVSSGAEGASALLKPSGLEAKLGEMIPFVGAAGGGVCFTRTGLVSGPLDMPKVAPQKLIYGYMAPTRGLAFIDLLAMNLLGFEAKKYVWGYSGSGDVRLGLIRGEVDFYSEGNATYVSAVLPLVNKGEMMPLWSSGVIGPKGDVVREDQIACLKNVLIVPEVYKAIYGKDPSGLSWDMYKAGVGACRSIYKAILANPKIPKEAVDALTAGCVAMLKDPEFIAANEKTTGGDIVFAGEDVKTIAKVAWTERTELTKALRDFFTKYGEKFD